MTIRELTLIFVIALSVAAIEAFLYWVRISIDKKMARKLDNSLLLLIPHSIPWWSRWVRNLWITFHLAVFVALGVIGTTCKSINRNWDIQMPYIYVHIVNFLILTGFFVWIVV